MPPSASLEGPHPSAHTRTTNLTQHSAHLKPFRTNYSLRGYSGTPCGARHTGHTLVPSLQVRAAYSSGPRELEQPLSGRTIPDNSFGGQAQQQRHDSPSAAAGVQQQQPGSPSGIVSLMQAWGQLSIRLQQPTTAGSTSSDDDDSVTQLILSALKLAVRSLSRVPATAASTDSPASTTRSSSSSSSSSSSRNKPAVQRSLALAAALAELYANGLPLDAASIAAGIVAEAVDVAALHIRTVQAKLGHEVAGLVQDVLAVRHAPKRAPVLDDASSSALRGWLLTAYDVRACAIEVVWRWLALVQPPSQLYQQQLVAMEALTIYCPIGHALGLGVCSSTLEDAAFKVLFPSSYASTARHVLPMSSAAAELLTRCQATLQQLAAADATFQQLSGGLQLLSRTKSLYSIMRKLLRLNDPAAGSRRLGQMYDLLGMRAVVLPRTDLPQQEAEAAAVQACYRLQELAHQQWPAVPGRSKDYITKSKSNGYQSLHSTLHMQQQQQQQQHGGSSSSSNSVVLSYLELQIRTAAMHAAAEGGDAAHAGYKGRLEKRQVRHLQAWTAQLQQRLAAPQQQLLLTLPGPGSSSSNSSGAVFQPTFGNSGFDTISTDDSDALPSSSSEGVAAAAAVELVEHQPAAAEAAAAAVLFRHLDLDGDGMLSLYELTALLSELGEHAPYVAAAAATRSQSSYLQQSVQSGFPAAAMASTPAAYAQQLFEMLDSNGDGLISMAEFLNFYMSHTTGSQAAAAAADPAVLQSSSNSSSSTALDHQCGSSSSSSSMSCFSSNSGSASASAVCKVFMHTHPAAIGASSSSSSSRVRQQQQRRRPHGVSAVGSSSSILRAAGRSRHQISCQCLPDMQAGSSGSSSGSSSSSVNGMAAATGTSSSMNGNGAYTAAAAGTDTYKSSSTGSSAHAAAAAGAASDGSVGYAGSRQQEVQQQQQQPPLRRPDQAADAVQGQHIVAAAVSGQPEQQQQQQQLLDALRDNDNSSSSEAAVAGGSSSSSSSSSIDDIDAEAATLHQQQQQQFEAELSYEEDEQQQQRFLRQQQRQLPTLLDDAAAGTSPCYVLTPIAVYSGSSNNSDNNNAAATTTAAAAAIQPMVADCLGQQLQQIEVPCLGPLMITNAPQIFASSDVIVDAPTEHYDRLALTLELIKKTGSRDAILQARNVSRVVRGRLDEASLRINHGQSSLQPHRAAVELIDGDIVEFGETGVAFVVQQVDRPAQSPTAAALQRFCGVYAEQQLGLYLPIQEAVDILQQQTQPQQAPTLKQQQQQSATDTNSSSSSSSASGQQGRDAAAAADDVESELRQISRLARSNAAAAEAALCQLAAAHPTAAGPWFLWAQLAASSRRPWMARQLFYAAAVCQQQQLQLLLQQNAEPAALAPRQQQQQQQPQPSHEAAEQSPDTVLPPAPIVADVPDVSSSSSSTRKNRRRGGSSSEDRSPAFRLSSRLVQVLRVWARCEWDQKLFGAARRLWRLAANEAFKYPYDISSENGGAVLHAWATAEFERDNVLNARVVIGEALRKCPKDAAIAVLAAGIEASAGEYNTARALFLRAYQLNKADKQLYMQWPRMEGICGNIERARLLFQYGLSLHPNNTKILNNYAYFEEGQGNVDLARELHERALGIDSASLTSMHNRVSWADLELRAGNVDVARELLREGLDAHPDFPAALLLMAKIERQSGHLVVAEAYARRAQKASHSFAAAAMRELAAIYAAQGEKGLAANLNRHLANFEAMQAQKQAGKVHGNQGWIDFYARSSQSGQREVMQTAWERKRELGLIRPQRGVGRRKKGRSQQQQHGRHLQEQQHDDNARQHDGLNFDSVELFDFAAAAAAAAEQRKQPRKQQQQRRA